MEKNTTHHTTNIWRFITGIILFILGLLAFGAPIFTTLASIYAFGWISLLSGIVLLIYGIVKIFQKEVATFFLFLLIGALSSILGILFINYSAATSLTLTLLVATFFLVEGIFLTITAVTMRFAAWGWSLFHGLLSLLLGILTLRHWPISGLLLIGIFIGIEFIMCGISTMIEAFLPKEATRKFAAI